MADSIYNSASCPQYNKRENIAALLEHNATTLHLAGNGVVREPHPSAPCESLRVPTAELLESRAGCSIRATCMLRNYVHLSRHSVQAITKMSGKVREIQSSRYTGYRSPFHAEFHSHHS